MPRRRNRTGKMTLKMEQAIQALMTHATIAAAAREIGVNDKSLRKWMRNPVFASELEAARMQFRQQTVGLLVKASTNAVVTLARVIQPPAGADGKSAEEKTADRIRAAVAILEFSLRGSAAIAATAPSTYQEAVLSQEDVLRSFAESVAGTVENPPAWREAAKSAVVARVQNPAIDPDWADSGPAGSDPDWD